MPSSLVATCQERQSDAYFTLETQKPVIRSPVKRNLRKARQNLRVESSSTMQDVHQELMHEFVARTMLAERVKRLLYKMPEFVAGSDMALVLNAWDKKINWPPFMLSTSKPRGFPITLWGAIPKKTMCSGLRIFYYLS